MPEAPLYYVAYLEPSSNLWCWTLYNANDRMIARNVEKYYSKADCIAAINAVKSSSAVPVKERSPGGSPAVDDGSEHS